MQERDLDVTYTLPVMPDGLEKSVGALSMWSTFRDQRCADGTSTSKASDTCSGVDQTAGAFAKALAG